MGDLGRAIRCPGIAGPRPWPPSGPLFPRTVTGCLSNGTLDEKRLPPMRSFQGKRFGPPLPPLTPLFWAVAGVGLVAVLWAAGPRSPRPPSAYGPPLIRYFTLGHAEFADHPRRFPHARDTETGSDMLCPIPGAWSATHLSCSPWRDSEGQYHLVGVCPDETGDPYGLVLYNLPAGRILSRVQFDFLPIGRPCWSPDRSDRILFGGTRSRALPLRFARGQQGPKPIPGPAALGGVADRPSRTRQVLVKDPCWPSVPARWPRPRLAGLSRDLPQAAWTVRLWWLKLRPDGGAIVAAECAIVPGEEDARKARLEEHYPSVGTTRDGTPLLAYLAKDLRLHEWQLWVMPIAPAASGRRPQVRLVRPQTGKAL